MSTIDTFIQNSIRSPSNNSHTRKRNKNFLLGKEAVKLSLFTYDMIIYIENLKTPPKKIKTIETKYEYEFSKTSGYKINI